VTGSSPKCVTVRVRTLAIVASILIASVLAYVAGGAYRRERERIVPDVEAVEAGHEVPRNQPESRGSAGPVSPPPIIKQKSPSSARTPKTVTVFRVPDPGDHAAPQPTNSSDTSVASTFATAPKQDSRPVEQADAATQSSQGGRSTPESSPVSSGGIGTPQPKAITIRRMVEVTQELEIEIGTMDLMLDTYCRSSNATAADLVGRCQNTALLEAREIVRAHLNWLSALEHVTPAVYSQALRRHEQTMTSVHQKLAVMRR
jgi:hypothetical protein